MNKIEHNNNGSFGEVPSSILPPLSSYLYFPQEGDIKQGKLKKAQRFIFLGGVKYDDFENQNIQLCRDLFRESGIKLPEFINDSEILRFLQANKFNSEKAKRSMMEHFKWREQNIPTILSEDAKNLINSGFMYIYGRDLKYRPVIVLNPAILERLKPSLEQLLNAVTFILEYLKRNMLLPGQIENWVIVCDIAKLSISKIPKSQMKSLISVLQNNFRCRLAKMYIVNATTTLNFFWKIVETFLEKHTKEKIQFSKKQNEPELLTFISPNQLEKKFGGTADPPTHFWPPSMPNMSFNDGVKNHVSSEKYKQIIETNTELVRMPEPVKNEEVHIMSELPIVFDKAESKRSSISISHLQENVPMNQMECILDDVIARRASSRHCRNDTMLSGCVEIDIEDSFMGTLDKKVNFYTTSFHMKHSSEVFEQKVLKEVEVLEKAPTFRLEDEELEVKTAHKKENQSSGSQQASNVEHEYREQMVSDRRSLKNEDNEEDREEKARRKSSYSSRISKNIEVMSGTSKDFVIEKAEMDLILDANNCEIASSQKIITDNSSPESLKKGENTARVGSASSTTMDGLNKSSKRHVKEGKAACCSIF